MRKVIRNSVSRALACSSQISIALATKNCCPKHITLSPITGKLINLLAFFDSRSLHESCHLTAFRKYLPSANPTTPYDQRAVQQLHL